jgi:hypothetical protein
MRNLNRFNLCAECPDFLTRRLFDQREVLVDHGFFDLAPARSVPSVMPPGIKARGIEATSEVGNYSRKFIPVVTAGIAAIPCATTTPWRCKVVAWRFLGDSRREPAPNRETYRLNSFCARRKFLTYEALPIYKLRSNLLDIKAECS